MFEPTLKDLMIKCREWGVELDEEKLEHTMNKTKGVDKYSRWDLTKLIVDKTIEDYYQGNVPNSARWINRWESCQLCARFPELKPEQQELLLKDNNEFYVEQKFNGIRTSIIYSPKEGLKFYANNRDTDNLLVTDNTPQTLLIHNGVESLPSDYINKFQHSFVLDAECIVDTKYVDTSMYGGAGTTESELNACNTILQIDPESAHEIQRTQKGCQLKFYIFDIRYFDKDIMNQPLSYRNKIRDALLQKLSLWNLPFYNVPRVYTDKKGYFEKLTARNLEGVVFKSENGIYTPNKTRGKLHQVKWKRSVSMTLGDTDGFIIGHEDATEGKAFAEAGYIGGIKIGCILQTIEGNEKVHHIASITGIPEKLRKDMSIIDKETGKPVLNPKYLNKCLTFDGFTVSPKSLRFTHARVEDWNTCWRLDKTPEMCCLAEEVLRTQIL